MAGLSPMSEPAKHGSIPSDAVDTSLMPSGRRQKGDYVRGMASTSLPTRAHRHPRRLRTRRKPILSVKQILEWADAHFERTGRWPKEHSGPITDAPGETWLAVTSALREGLRGLSGGSSLPRLLAKCRKVRNLHALPPYTTRRILAWADAHRLRHGRWPTRDSGPIKSMSGETWGAINAALQRGMRGLPRGSSLARLLARHRGRRNHLALPRHSVGQVRRWADSYFVRHGKWPTASSGPIDGAPGETWHNVDQALRQGVRGLPGGSSLFKLLRARRRPRAQSRGATTRNRR